MVTDPVSHWHFQSWHHVTWIQKMVILREILGAVIWIVFNKSWHSIACCQRWPKGKSLLVHFLLNWKWHGMLKAFLLLFVTNKNFTAKFSCWRVLICVPTARGRKIKYTEIEFTLSWLQHCFQIILSNDNVFSLWKPIFIDKEVFTEMRWGADVFAWCS